MSCKSLKINTRLYIYYLINFINTNIYHSPTGILVYTLYFHVIITVVLLVDEL